MCSEAQQKDLEVAAGLHSSFTVVQRCVAIGFELGRTNCLAERHGNRAFAISREQSRINTEEAMAAWDGGSVGPLELSSKQKERAMEATHGLYEAAEATSIQVLHHVQLLSEELITESQDTTGAHVVNYQQWLDGTVILLDEGCKRMALLLKSLNLVFDTMQKARLTLAALEAREGYASFRHLMLFMLGEELAIDRIIPSIWQVYWSASGASQQRWWLSRITDQLGLSSSQTKDVHAVMKVHNTEMQSIEARGVDLGHALHIAVHAALYQNGDPSRVLHLDSEMDAFLEALMVAEETFQEDIAEILTPRQQCAALCLAIGRSDVVEAMRVAGPAPRKHDNQQGLSNEEARCHTIAVQAAHHWEENSNGGVQISDQQVRQIGQHLVQLCTVQRQSSIKIRAASWMCVRQLEDGVVESRLEGLWGSLKEEINEAAQSILKVRKSIYDTLTPTQRILPILVDTRKKVLSIGQALSLGLLEDIDIVNIAPKCVYRVWLTQAGAADHGQIQELIDATGASKSRSEALLAAVMQHEDMARNRHQRFLFQIHELETQVESEFRAMPPRQSTKVETPVVPADTSKGKASRTLSASKQQTPRKYIRGRPPVASYIWEMQC